MPPGLRICLRVYIVMEKIEMNKKNRRCCMIDSEQKGQRKQERKIENIVSDHVCMWSVGNIK